jgi:NitT/TauT family transport system ATP-binding protein
MTESDPVRGSAAPRAVGDHAGHGEGEVRVDAVSVSLVDRTGQRLELIEDCSFRAERGRFTVVIGPSGCGKTSLMNLIAGFERPNSGRITIDGHPIDGAGSDRLMVFQETALFPWMTTLANVTYGPTVRRIASRAEIDAKARDILDRFGLSQFADRYPNELSGGMQRRAELARALINDPLVMLMDEPFRGLDAMTRQLMQEYLVNLFESTRKTTIFVTSEIDEAIFLADQIIVLSRAPARAAATLAVDLPRPRRFNMLASRQYGDLKRQALDLLYAEASALFSSSGEMSDLKEAFEARYEK